MLFVESMAIKVKRNVLQKRNLKLIFRILSTIALILSIIAINESSYALNKLPSPLPRKYTKEEIKILREKLKKCNELVVASRIHPWTITNVCDLKREERRVNREIQGDPN